MRHKVNNIKINWRYIGHYAQVPLRCASELSCDPNGEVAFLFGCSRTIQKITDFALADMQSM